MNFDNLGGRKFIATMTIFILTSMLMWFGKITDGVFQNIFISTIVAYIGGNVYQKVNERIESGTKEGSDEQ